MRVCKLSWPVREASPKEKATCGPVGSLRLLVRRLAAFWRLMSSSPHRNSSPPYRVSGGEHLIDDR